MGINFRRPLNPFGIRFGEALVWTKTGSTPPEEKYSITVSLTNPINPEECDRIEIYEVLDPTLDEGGHYLPQNEQLLTTLTDPTASSTVQISTSSYGITVSFYQIGPVGTTWWNDSDVTCTGGVQYNADYPDDASFQVTSNGTCTINNVYYNDD